MRALTALLLFLAGAGSSADAGFTKQVDAFLQPYVTTNNFSGAVLVARDGRVLLRKAYGLANQELSVANTPATRFQIASLSKPFTAAAILILEQQGRLAVEDPVRKLLPDYPGGEKITIHHLLVHRAGIPNVNSLPEYEQKSRSPQTLADVITLFRDRPLDFPPGSKYRYSNSNYNLLAAIIEKASGLSFGEFLERHVFGPAGMGDSGHRGDSGMLLRDRAAGYVPAGRDGLANAPHLEWSIKIGNGSVYSTVDDLHRWDRALRGTKILSSASKEKMFRDYGDGTGYGWFLPESGARRIAQMGGRSPGFNSWVERSLEDDLVVILLSNNYSSIGQTLGRQLAELARGKKPESPLAGFTGASDPLPAGYLGEYQFGQDFVYNPGLTVRLDQTPGGLVMRTSAGDSYLIPAGALRFLDRLYGGVVRFITEGDRVRAQVDFRFGLSGGEKGGESRPLIISGAPASARRGAPAA